MGVAGIVRMGFGEGPGRIPTLGFGVGAETADDLVSACWLQLSTTPALADAFGRSGWLSIDEAPADAELPYATVEQVGSEDEILTFSGGYEATGDITVSIYATTKRKASRLAEAVRDALRLVSVTIEGRTTKDIFVEGGESEYLGRGAGGVTVYLQTVDFSVAWPGELPS